MVNSEFCSLKVRLYLCCVDFLGFFLFFFSLSSSPVSITKKLPTHLLPPWGSKWLSSPCRPMRQLRAPERDAPDPRGALLCEGAGLDTTPPGNHTCRCFAPRSRLGSQRKRVFLSGVVSNSPPQKLIGEKGAEGPAEGPVRPDTRGCPAPAPVSLRILLEQLVGKPAQPARALCSRSVGARLFQSR